MISRVFIHKCKLQSLEHHLLIDKYNTGPSNWKFQNEMDAQILYATNRRSELKNNNENQ